MKILVVAEEEWLRQLIHEEIVKAGHDAVPVADGAQAWELLQVQVFHAVISQWHAPEVGGVELIRRAREARLLFTPYMILIRERDDAAQMGAGPETGADDFLNSPILVSDLLARLATADRIAELEQKLQKLRLPRDRALLYDSPSGLLKREVIQEQAETEWSRASRYGRPLSFVLLHLENLGSLHDRYGHQTGDQVARLVASTISQNIRPYDIAGRWSPSEFLLVLPETSHADAAAVAERVRERVGAIGLLLPDESWLKVDARTSVVQAPPEVEDLSLESLVRDAGAIIP